MPELPDLQVFAKNLMKRIGHRPIRHVEVSNTKRVNLSVDKINEIWTGEEVTDIIRIGKELYFYSNSGQVFSVHLMLNGTFSIFEKDKVKETPYKVISFEFDENTVLVIADYQGLCKVTFDPLISEVPDALGNSFSYSYFSEAVRKNCRKNVKAFLINQDIVKGIGNAYADEILWNAGISPESTVGKIPIECLLKLYNSIRDVLTEAIAKIEELKPDILSGEERSFLQVHNPNRKKTDDGATLVVKKIASKTTYYTERQQLFK